MWSLPTWTKPDKAWVQDLKAVDPKLNIVWGGGCHYQLDYWIIEREVSPEFLKDWDAQRKAHLQETGKDDMGARPTHVLVLAIKTPDGKFRSFGPDIIDWLKGNDTWKRWKTAKDYLRARYKAHKEFEEAQKARQVKEMGYALEHAGFRFVRHSDGELHISNRIMGKPILCNAWDDPEIIKARATPSSKELRDS